MFLEVEFKRRFYKNVPDLLLLKWICDKTEKGKDGFLLDLLFS